MLTCCPECGGFPAYRRLGSTELVCEADHSYWPCAGGCGKSLPVAEGPPAKVRYCDDCRRDKTALDP